MHPPRYGSCRPQRAPRMQPQHITKSCANRKLESGQNKLIRVENLKQQQRSNNERTPACMPRAHAMHACCRAGPGCAHMPACTNAHAAGGEGEGRRRDRESSSSGTKAKGLSRALGGRARARHGHGGGGHAAAAGPALQVAKPGRFFCPCHTRVHYSLCSSCCRWRSIDRLV